METDNSFLGTGWSFPPTFHRNGVEVEMVSAGEDIAQSLQIILSTSLGERIMFPDFGCELNHMLFGELTPEAFTEIKGMIFDALLYHEPRISIENIDITEGDAAQRLLHIVIEYTIHETNLKYKMLYPLNIEY